jgi:hypothetical protein
VSLSVCLSVCLCVCVCVCVERKRQRATGYGLDAWGWVSGRGKIFLFSIASTLALGPTQSPIQLVPEAASPRVKRQRGEADHSSPFSAKVKNGGAILSLSHKSSRRGKGTVVPVLN